MRTIQQVQIIPFLVQLRAVVILMVTITHFLVKILVLQIQRGMKIPFSALSQGNLALQLRVTPFSVINLVNIIEETQTHFLAGEQA